MDYKFIRCDECKLKFRISFGDVKPPWICSNCRSEEPEETIEN